MKYAGEGVISEEPFEGCIEITDEQYQEAFTGMLSGMIVSVADGFSVKYPPEPEPEVVEPVDPEPIDPEPVDPEPVDPVDPEPKRPTIKDVDIERDRRISDGFYFEGIHYQARPEDRENIVGAVSAAGIAIRNGALEGDVYWKGGDLPFIWIASDNSLQPMDAQTVEAFGLTALNHKEFFILAARRIKDMDVIPDNYADDEHWYVGDK